MVQYSKSWYHFVGVIKWKYTTTGIFQNFDYCQINFTFNFTLKSMENACLIKILWDVTWNSYNFLGKHMHKPSFYQNMKLNESFTDDIFKELNHFFIKGR